MKQTIIAAVLVAAALSSCTPVEMPSSDVAAVSLQPVNDAEYNDAALSVVKARIEEQRKKAEEEKQRIEEEQQQREAEEEAAAKAEEAAQAWYEIDYATPEYEPVYESYNAYEADVSRQIANENSDLKSAGVLYDEAGTRYTWYSENVLPGGGLTELNNNGRTTNEQGYVVDADGFIAVASGEYEQGTILETPFGEAKVYDYCETPGTIDIYTSW